MKPSARRRNAPNAGYAGGAEKEKTLTAKWARRFLHTTNIDGTEEFRLLHYMAPPPLGVAVEATTPVVERNEVVEWSVSFDLSLDQQDLDEITKTLNIIRQTVYTDESLSYDPGERISAAIPHLIEDLPLWISSLPDVEPTPYRRATLQAAFALLDAAKRASPFLVNKPSRKGATKWHDDANFLAFILRRAAHRCGSDPKLGSALAGGVGFISQALRRVGLIPISGAGGASTEAVYKAILRVKDRPVLPVLVLSHVREGSEIGRSGPVS